MQANVIIWAPRVIEPSQLSEAWLGPVQPRLLLPVHQCQSFVIKIRFDSSETRKVETLSHISTSRDGLIIFTTVYNREMLRGPGVSATNLVGVIKSRCLVSRSHHHWSVMMSWPRVPVSASHHLSLSPPPARPAVTRTGLVLAVPWHIVLWASINYYQLIARCFKSCHWSTRAPAGGGGMRWLMSARLLTKPQQVGDK